MWVSSVLWLALAGVVAALRCPGGQVCDDGSRCCELPGAESACCPQGVVRSLPMVKAGSVNEISENLCPTNVSCPSEYSCLRTPAGLYSCCPLSEAVSCADSRHCCPRDSLCSLDGKFCLSGNIEIGAVICPGGKLECPEQTTCCLTVDGSWGCCPLPQAICCEDKEHCCPHDTTCDMVHAKCLSSEGKKPMWSKFPARKRAAWENTTAVSSRDNKCEDGSTCPDWTTCCQQQNPKFGCCPMQNAVCCADHIHCCPEGTKCDLIRSICVGTYERSQSPLLTKVLDLAKKGEDVNCDDTTSCPDGQTCCRLQSGEWGCCPFAEAVCCSDKVHCCPKGFTCITEEGSCKQSALSIPWTAKTPAQLRETMSSKDVPCDDEVSCADGQTCCRSTSGEWACCPLPQAVCCSDHIHCCPTSSTCNIEAGTCEQNALSIPWTVKTLAQVKKTTNSKDVKCDDETSCADGQTCCRTAEGEWGCCPLPAAVCCSDHVHCCPKDYTCNTAAGTCVQSPVSIPWSAKTPLRGWEILINKDVKCDDETSCADGQTCCRAASGEWACCPLSKAVCCSDHVHCCPAGYTCNTSAGSCDKSLLSIPWVSKTQSQVTEPQQSTDVKCDDTASCKDGQTCCKTQSGDWACCHLPSAVCCEDYLHCCPSGYTCNLSAQTCEKQGLMLPWKPDLSVTLLPLADDTERDVKCDDLHYCKSGQTCCKTTTAGGWSCCPFNQGVCCKDMRHCCSAGYKCSFTGRRCIKSKVLRWDENFSTKQQQQLDLL